MRPGLIFDNALMIQIMLERLKSSTADTRELVSGIRAAVASALSGYSGSVSSVSRAKSIALALRKTLKPVLSGYSDRLLDDIINAAVVMADAEYHGFNSLVKNVNPADTDKVRRDV